MTRIRVLHRALLGAVAALLMSCSTTVYKEVYPTLSDGKYDSEFPYRGSSRQLEEISGTVKMVSCIAYYRTYSFLAEERITRQSLPDEFFKKREKTAVYGNSTSSGTATIIWYDNRRVVMLTCAHIIDFDDTLRVYHTRQDGRPTPYLRSVGIKEKQSNYVAVFPEGGELEVLAMDRTNDVALLGRHFITEPPFRIPVFRYPTGKAKELEWGSFVYLFGYPSGYRMITKGIVSSPNKDRRGTFLVDANFTRGFSGGIVLGIRDGVPNFELVGMIKLVSAHSSLILAPEKRNGDVTYDPDVPYTGPVFVERRTEIEAGITQAVSIETILEVIENSREQMATKGYRIDRFTAPEPPGAP